MPECKGVCRCMPELKAVPHTHGRVPRDPATGRVVPSGTYGSWKRCRMCDVLIVWTGKFCPCCGRILSVRPRAARHRRSRKLAKSSRFEAAGDGAAAAAAADGGCARA